ncbi:hypothetical protein FISHEDRAFT_12200, partial [Fistulina hepatica ATCC 64428]
MKKLPFPKDNHFCTMCPFQIVHTNVFDPISPASPEGFWYGMAYDQFKLDIKEYFQAEVGEFRLAANFIEFLRSDNGGEYVSTSFREQL